MAGFIEGEAVWYSAYPFPFFSFFRLNEGDAYYLLKDFSLLIRSIGYDILSFLIYNTYFIFKAT